VQKGCEQEKRKQEGGQKDVVALGFGGGGRRLPKRKNVVLSKKGRRNKVRKEYRDLGG